MKAALLPMFFLFIVCLNIRAQNSPVEISVLKDDLTFTVVPYLHENKVLFQDFTDGFVRFYTIDIENRAVTEIRRNSKYLYPAAFSGSYVAWIEYSTQFNHGGGGYIPIDTTAKYQVKAMRVSDRTELNLTSDTTYKEHIAAYGNRVVWSDYRHFSENDSTVEIYMYDFSTRQEVRITEASGYKAYPHIYGEKIVWQDYRIGSGHCAIYMYDLQTETESIVTDYPSYKAQPHIYDNRVVWQDYRNSLQGEKHTDIFMKDLDSGIETQISSDAFGYKNSPKIFDNFIVWQDHRHAQQDTLNTEIYLYDFARQTEFAVTSKTGYMGEPFLWNNYITWQDYDDGFLYLGTISDEISVKIKKNTFPVKSAINQTERFYTISGRTISNSAVKNNLIIKRNKNGVAHRIINLK